MLEVLVVTNMWPTGARPALGPFVRDQVEALRAREDIDLELHWFVPPGGLAPYVRAAFDIARRFRGRRYDVVHAHYGLTGWCALAVRGRAHVVTYHGDDLRLRKVAGLGALLSRLVTLPATVSGDLARSEARRLGGPGERRRVAVLPCGVDLARFRPLDRRRCRERLGLDPDGRYLLFPADPARPEKRHDRARALADAAGAELIAYSATPPELVPTYINAANAVVVTSEREGFGLAPLEALACEVPVVATPIGIAPLALEGVPGALCAEFDLERWRAALEPHLSSPDPRAPGRRRAEIFSSARMAERVAIAYRELACADPPGSPGLGV
ncbi:MAG: glycosyltransferase [Thermoleophilaceae bacterium]|nr:glycosyltransferase [Thermoleophilaceae bacterium]